jgi:Tol biopolymer transport system component
MAPDGRSLAYVKDRAVWVRDGRGKEQRVFPLKRDWIIGNRIVWSSDGKQLIISHGEEDRGRAGNFETWQCATDGSTQRKLPIADADYVSDWSPDGKWLLIGRNRINKRWMDVEFYLTRLDSTDERRLTKAGYNARFSPDGRTIAYLGKADPGLSDVWLMNLDGTNARRVLGQPNLNCYEVCWSPDGKRLAITYNEQVEIVNPDNGRTGVASRDNSLVIVDSDGGNRHEVKLPRNDFGAVFFGHMLDWR